MRSLKLVCWNADHLAADDIELAHDTFSDFRADVICVQEFEVAGRGFNWQTFPGFRLFENCERNGVATLIRFSLIKNNTCDVFTARHWQCLRFSFGDNCTFVIVNLHLPSESDLAKHSLNLKSDILDPLDVKLKLWWVGGG